MQPLPLVLVLSFVLLMFFGFLQYQKLSAKKWSLVGEGVFKEVVYSTPPKRIHMHLTIGVVHFEDGEYCIITPLEMPPRGTKMRIYRNGCAEFKIEKAA